MSHEVLEDACAGDGVDAAVREVDSMKEGRRPKFGVQCRAVEETAHRAGNGVVPTFGAAVLLGAVSTSRFNNIVMALLHGADEFVASGKLAALVASDDTS